MKTTLVSATDSNYFKFAYDLVKSVRALSESHSLDLCILDLGMTAEQIKLLTPIVTRIISSRWDVDFPDRDKCPIWYRAMFSRPYLPRYFPDSDLIAWLDADAWLCNWDAMRMLLAAAGQRPGIAIVPELDRCYTHCFQLRPGVIQNLRDSYTEGFGSEAADKYAPLPVINAGVWAMRRDTSYWEIWAQLLSDALQRSRRLLTDQCALNIAIFTGKIPPYFLPAWCNWNCGASLPVLRAPTRDLLVPMLPHERISICHLIDVKDEIMNVLCTDGTMRRTRLTHHEVREMGAGSDKVTK